MWYAVFAPSAAQPAGAPTSHGACVHPVPQAPRATVARTPESVQKGSTAQTQQLVSRVAATGITVPKKICLRVMFACQAGSQAEFRARGGVIVRVALLATSATDLASELPASRVLMHEGVKENAPLAAPVATRTM